MVSCLSLKLLVFHVLYLCPALILTPVSIGLQQTAYSVLESEDYQFVCAEVQSGDVAEREIEIDFVIDNSGNVANILF